LDNSWLSAQPGLFKTLVFLANNVLAKKDMDKGIADRAEWRWCREDKLPRSG